MQLCAEPARCRRARLGHGRAALSAMRGPEPMPGYGQLLRRGYGSLAAAARGCADCGWELSRRTWAENAHLRWGEVLLCGLCALGWTVLRRAAARRVFRVSTGGCGGGASSFPGAARCVGGSFQRPALRLNPVGFAARESAFPAAVESSLRRAGGPLPARLHPELIARRSVLFSWGAGVAHRMGEVICLCAVRGALRERSHPGQHPAGLGVPLRGRALSRFPVQQGRVGGWGLLLAGAQKAGPHFSASAAVCMKNVLPSLPSLAQRWRGWRGDGCVLQCWADLQSVGMQGACIQPAQPPGGFADHHPLPVSTVLPKKQNEQDIPEGEEQS